MKEYIYLMHNDDQSGQPLDWEPYIAKLSKAGHFEGGSAIGNGICVAKARSALRSTSPLTGYMRIRAESLSDAERLLAGNPIYEAGGTVEIRELTRS